MPQLSMCFLRPTFHMYSTWERTGLTIALPAMRNERFGDQDATLETPLPVLGWGSIPDHSARRPTPGSTAPASPPVTLGIAPEY